jgi:hypothetical protein
MTDKLMDWAWLAMLAVGGWAWRMNERMATIEAKQKATEEMVGIIHDDIKGVDTKLDRLIDKLL